jgi:hypothetical protein
MARRSPPRKITYFEPVLPRLARNTIMESTFEVGRRSAARCGSKRLDEEELADWRAGRNAVYLLAALTVGTRLAVADA